MFGAMLLKLLRKRNQKKRKARRKSRLSDNYLTQLQKASLPKGTKMQFPYDVPPIETVISIDPNASQVLKTFAISIGAGIAIGGVAGAAGRIISSKK